MHPKDKIKIDTDRIVLKLDQHSGIQCDLKVPAESRLHLKGSNGKVTIDEPRFHLDLDMANGLVEVNPEEGSEYRYAINVTNGKVASFQSSDSPSAYEIKIHLANGMVN